MDREMFDEAIGEVPRSTVDVDGVVARGRRAARIRRVANPWVATAAGVVAITFGAVAVLLPGNHGGSVGAGAAPPQPVSSVVLPPVTSSVPPSTPVTCGGRTAVPQVPATEAAATSARLTSALTSAVQAALPPGGQLTANPTGEYPKGTPHGPLEFYYVFQPLVPLERGCQGGVSEYSAWATISLSGVKKGNLMALITPPSVNSQPLACSGGTVAGAQYSCDRQAGPNGEAILTSTLTQNGGGPTLYRVEVDRLDGTSILLDSANVAGDAKQGGRPTSPAPLLTHQQLITIALGDGLTLGSR
jgi:hypothetical protein